MSETPEHVKCLIIGSGPAGYAAAIYAARADLKPVMYEGPVPGGQLTQTTEVDNYPGYPKGRTGPEMMEDLKAQAQRFETDVRSGWVTKVDLSGPVHKVWVDEKTEIHADAVIISTGASANWLGLPNELRLRDLGGGVTACAVCDGFFYRGQTVALVGAGDSACEEATYLAKLCPKVYMLVRKDMFRASKAMVHRVENTPNIEVLFNTEVKDVLGEHAVEGLITVNNKSGEERKLDVTGLFIAIGHKPATDLFKGWLDMDETGYLKHTPDRTTTKIPGVFVAGDAADRIYRQAVTSAGTGCMAALDAERYLAAAGKH
ncbi:MAG: thioredoxin-disulfide reductase [Bacteroidetes bacterium]|jgi:thioredoxin reductase (NADPH)|nr:thioredoxin-disulfide reductase [Bacteroidota bacterium]MBX7129967.1 thioredoxin-disulfide reductase [Flavobacteriales bacterium]MCC6654635.1 thioredoxin-disulfide reductase [Flavobacteriales bacterium]HMU14907.1 thioredoxin-disulfide reductase [Flavobacteriales bacterium]HMW95686.1 thioredoxin-disulfide reductase [Flavobacteriales bacterium]